MPIITDNKSFLLKLDHISDIITVWLLALRQLFQHIALIC